MGSTGSDPFEDTLSALLGAPQTQPRRRCTRRMRATGRFISLAGAAGSCATLMSIWRLLGSAEPVPPLILQTIGIYANTASTAMFMLASKCDWHDQESFEVSIKLLQFDLLWVLMTSLSTAFLFVAAKIRFISIPFTLTAGVVAVFHALVMVKTAIMELYGELALTMRQIRNDGALRPGENVYVESEPYRKQRNGGSGLLLGKADPDDKDNKPCKDQWRVQYPTGNELWRDDLLHHSDDWALTAAWLIVLGVTFYGAQVLVDNISGASPLPAVVAQNSKASWSSLGVPEGTASASAEIDEPLWDPEEDEEDEDVFSDLH